MRTRTYRTLVYLGGGLGAIAAAFSGAEFYDAELSKACSFNGYISCAKVANSGLTTTFGIQDWIWGIAGFIVILALAVLAERRRRDAWIPYLLLLVTTAGLALSVYFGYVEVVQIGGVCPVCITAYAMGAVAWVGAIGLAQRAYRRGHRPPDDATAAG